MQYRFLTSTRDDLVTLSKIFARALRPAILARSNKPVVVRVNGACNSGKKILPDVIRSELFGAAVEHCDGKEEYDERIEAMLEGRPMRADFINLFWDEGYSDEAFDRIDSVERRKCFLRGNHLPGLVFVHNDWTDKSIPNFFTYDLDIWVEGASGVPDSSIGRDHRRLIHGTRLRDTFNMLATSRQDSGYDEQWVRYVEVNVRRKSGISKDMLHELEPARRRLQLFHEGAHQAAKHLFGGIYAYT